MSESAAVSVSTASRTLKAVADSIGMSIETGAWGEEGSYLAERKTSLLWVRFSTVGAVSAFSGILPFTNVFFSLFFVNFWPLWRIII